MNYISTRGGGSPVSATEAIVRGLAVDGGLYVPESIPHMTPDRIEKLCALSYADRALNVLAPWLPEFSEEELSELLIRAYGTQFDVPSIAPVVKFSDDASLLELWHGPTLAFKDMALQLMPHLLTACAKKQREAREIMILVATSGDTGKAALEGFANVRGTSICVFYPEQGVSEAQRLQMVTQTGDNTRVIAVKGNFDDAQTGVKRIFSDSEIAKEFNARGIVLSSANSINLGRLLPQVAYYFSAYADLMNQGKLKMGEPLDVCVPTGNFGNILAAYYAKEMGLPIGRLVCASNSNNVLSDFIHTGIYDRNRPFHLTSSPSMDILISSNLERMLYALSDDSGVARCMKELKDTGRYELSKDAVAKLTSLMQGGWADEAHVMACIKKTFDETGYLLDPHTAVAVNVLENEKGSNHALIVSTASPYKFGRSVLSAITDADIPDDEFACCKKLSELSDLPVPMQILSLPMLPVLHHEVCKPEDMESVIMSK